MDGSRDANKDAFNACFASYERLMTALTKVELGEFRKLLEMLQARVRGDVSDIAGHAFDHDDSESRSPTHPAELGSENFEQEVALDLIRNEEEFLNDITDALEKIKAGTFGVCEGCLSKGVTEKKALINKARLKAVPWTRNCVDCERYRETH